MANCLSCSSEINIDKDAIVGEILECYSCGQEHEIVKSTDGYLTVNYAPDVEEDWGE
jgi:alpha-aminoadipate/glutamate carrier protein LysW